jgi:pseudomonalisin
MVKACAAGTALDRLAVIARRGAELTAAVLRLLAASLLVVSAVDSSGSNLVIGPVDRTRLEVLPGIRPAWAAVANDLGEVADDLPLSHLTVILERAAERQRAFEQLLEQQQDPASANFHRWLTPMEIGERFGASVQDIDAVSSWLEAQGLHVDAVANSRVRIDFSGSAAAVGAAFASRLHVYLVNGERRIAPAGAPQIPAALSTIVRAVHGLVTTGERPYHRIGTGEFGDGSRPLIQPAGTNCSGGTCTHYIFPKDFATIYNLNPVYGQGIDGSGQTIAIIGRARVDVHDIEYFQTRSDVPVKDPIVIVPPAGIDPGPASSSGGAPGDQIEATLDVTRATSVAPGATIVLAASASSITTNGLAVASQYVVDTNPVPAHVMSISFGICEALGGQPAVVLWDSLFSQAAAEGISVFVSSGDDGAAGCDTSGAGPHASRTPNVVCSSSHATCVGGTQFADTANPNKYWSSTNSEGFKSALGYIPEGAWNEPLDSSGDPQIAASGGGVSLYIPTPSWQAGPGVPGTKGRYTPDVSFSASAHDGYFGCVAADGASCVSDHGGLFRFSVFSGTSAAAPNMAGIAALLNHRMGAAQGNLNPRLYQLAAAPGNGVFHDVTVGTSGVSGCDASVPSMCNNSTPGAHALTGGLAGYLVGPGYDQATGLGSIDVANLLAHWSTAASPNYQGLWWKAPAGSESGWGINFAHQGDTIFASWFTYDTSGSAWWLVMTAPKTGANTYSGTLYETRGPAFGAVPWSPTGVTNNAAGSGTLTFTDANNGTFAYTVNGVSQAKSITRQLFGPMPTCTWGGQPNLGLVTNYQDLWWATPAGSESGWGINLTHQSDTIFASWFTYDVDGAPLWLVVTAPKTGPAQYSGDLYRTSGARFDAFNTADVVSAKVGTATFTFSDGNHAVFSYTVQVSGMASPATQAKSLTREIFSPPGTVCY